METAGLSELLGLKPIKVDNSGGYNVITKPKHYHIKVKTVGHIVDGYAEIDCLSVTQALGLHKRHYLASALAYVWRCTKKGTERDDIDKAIFYLNLAKEELDESNKG
jgi:hypothetical protein